MKKISFLSSTCLLLVFFMPACKKNKDAPAGPKTLLVSENSGASSSQYIYDNSNRLQRANHTDGGGLSSIFITSYVNGSEIAEFITRYGVPVIDAAKTVISYDGQGRVSKYELYDSIATGFVQVSVNNITYTTGKITSAVIYSGGAPGYRYEYTYDAAGNITLTEVYNSSGAMVQKTEYQAYDNKPTPGSALPVLYHFADSKNNATQFRETITGVAGTRDYTCAYEYNADGFPTKITLSRAGAADVVYTYAYEKR